MQKTYLELATDVVTAMINKGYLKAVPEKGEDWKSQNAKAVHTIGWAILQMYKEIQQVPRRAGEEERDERSARFNAKIIPAKPVEPRVPQAAASAR